MARYVQYVESINLNTMMILKYVPYADGKMMPYRELTLIIRKEQTE